MGALLLVSLPQHAGAQTPPSDAALVRQFEQGVKAYDAKRYARAFELWLPLAQNGDLAAQRNVAHMLRLGRGVAQDLPRARGFYEQSAEFGFVTAQTNLGMMLLNGEGGDKDYEEAAFWFDRAARGGHPIAQFQLARLYERGMAVAPNPGRALGWYALAARAGYQPALDRLAELVMELPGPSAPEGSMPGQTQDAHKNQMELGDQVELAPVPAPTQASKEAGEDARTSEASADIDTGTPANAPSVETDPRTHGHDLDGALAAYGERRFKEAQQVFETLAYMGDSEAQYRLARMRNRGEGEPRDPVAALAWWRVAADNGHEKASTAATELEKELGPRRRGEAEREAAQFRALISQLFSQKLTLQSLKVYRRAPETVNPIV